MPSPFHGKSVSRAPDESIAPDNAICRHLIKLRTPIRDAPFRAHGSNLRNAEERGSSPRRPTPIRRPFHNANQLMSHRLEAGSG